MNINATLFAQMITFGILIWVTMKFIWPPLAQAMDERAQRIAEGLAAADRAKAELQDANARVDEEIKKARVQASEIIDKAQQQANQILDKAKADALLEGARQKAIAQTEIGVPQPGYVMKTSGALPAANCVVSSWYRAALVAA